MYTNAEMIVNSQDNINLILQFKLYIPNRACQELNEWFEQLKTAGTLLEEAHIQQDKAKTLAYVLGDKSKRGNLATSEFEGVYGMN
jgi:hypothetical protein